MLELGAGNGRITKILAACAKEVVAVDIVPEMLELARRQLAGATNVSFMLADMRTVRLKRRFDLIVAANDPLSHLLEARERCRALATVAAHLQQQVQEQGVFVMDAHWFSEKAEARASKGVTRERRLGPADSALRIRRFCQCDPATQTVEERVEYQPQGEPAVVVTTRLHYWKPERLRDEFARSGLRVSDWWGGYKNEPFEQRTSAHLVVRAVLSSPIT